MTLDRTPEQLATALAMAAADFAATPETGGDTFDERQRERYRKVMFREISVNDALAELAEDYRMSFIKDQGPSDQPFTDDKIEAMKGKLVLTGVDKDGRTVSMWGSKYDEGFHRHFYEDQTRKGNTVVLTTKYDAYKRMASDEAC